VKQEQRRINYSILYARLRDSESVKAFAVVALLLIAGVFLWRRFVSPS